MIRRWSRHSRRRVPMKRSAIAFARGARIGVRMMRMSRAGEYRVEGSGELAVSVADQESEPVGVVAKVHEQVAGLLGDPGPGRVGGDAGDVHAAGAVLDHHQDVEAAQKDGVDVGEVDREDRVGLRGEELSPGRSGPLRGRVDAGGLQDCPDGGGGDVVAESDQFAVDASVAPGRVLPGHPQHQCPDRLWGGRAAWLASGWSSGGRRGGRASAAGFWETPAVAGAAGWAAVCSAR